jgi:ribosome-associated protein
MLETPLHYTPTEFMTLGQLLKEINLISSGGQAKWFLAEETVFVLACPPLEIKLISFNNWPSVMNSVSKKIFCFTFIPHFPLGQLLKEINLISSGGQAKWFLAEETVFVDGELENRRGRKLYPGMKICFPLGILS